MSEHFTCAVIVAAGNSTRMGYKLSKQLIPLNGSAAIEYTIKAFQACDMIDEIVIVARPVDIDDIAHIAFRYSKVSAVTAGGKTRTDSVYNGVHAADKRTTHYAIHDGARVLITQKEIEKVLAAAYETSAAVLGTPVTDTVKIADTNAQVQSTPDRSTLWAVQTPQVFEAQLYKMAMENARVQNLSVTDDCSMVEALGVPVSIVKGEYSNIKLTTPIDVIVAEAILAKRN